MAAQALAVALALARAPTSLSSPESADSPASPFDRLPDELIEEIGVHVLDEDSWSGLCDRSSVQAFSAACRRFWTILEPLRWKFLKIDTSTADFARLNTLLANVGRHVARLHLTFDARYKHAVDQPAACLHLLSSVDYFELLVIVSQRGTDVPPQRLTEIYEALRDCTTRLKVIKLRDYYHSIDFFAAGLAELLQQSTSLRAVDIPAQLSAQHRPPSPFTAPSHYCAVLANLAELRVAHLPMAVLSGLGRYRPDWPSLAYASLEIGSQPSAIELDLVLRNSCSSLRAIVLSAFSPDVRVADASGPLHFPKLETAVFATMEAFSLFRQLVHPSSPVHSLYISEVTSIGLQAVKAFYDDQPTKTLTRLFVPPEEPWNTGDVFRGNRARAIWDSVGSKDISMIEADEDSFCDELQRRAWQEW